jgi:hypothetical protein
MKLLNLFNWVDSLVSFFTFNVGGGGDSGGGGSQTSTSYSTNLPEYAQPYYQELMKQTGKNVYTTDAAGNVTGVKGMPTYEGNRIAGFTPGQEAIQREVSGLTLPGGFGSASTGLGTGQAMGFGAGAAGLGQAFGYSPMAVSGGTFDAPAASYYMSPYQSNVTDIAVREAEKQRDLARTGRMTGALGRGTFGGARQTLADVEAERGAAQGISDIRTRGQQEAFMNAQQQFERDQARRMQAAQLGQQAQQYQAGLGKDIGLAGLTTGIDASGKQAAVAAASQAANLERLKAQAATEGEKQALQQQINDLKYQTFQEQQNYQKSQLEYLSNILRGNAAALGSTNVQYTPQPSTISQIGGLGLAGLGLSKALG